MKKISIPGLFGPIVLACVLLMVSACAGNKPYTIELMPSPDVYDDGAIDPFTDTGSVNVLPYNRILYATDRLPADESDKSLPHFKTPYRDDTILRVSSDGQVLTEKSVHEIFVENGLFAVLVSNGRFPTRMNEYDALHVNDIEELKPDIANSFPAFEAGDLLLSMRHLNLLLVVDPDDWTVRWYKVGPWLRQHDPDFQADGRITVFNNNSDDTEKGEILGGSNIMSLRPAASVSDLSVIFGDGEGEWFFTNTQGKHQRLENGNFLVAEYYAGRVFEYNAERNIDWQYINVFDEDHAAKISGAERYPENYFSITDWRCSHK